MILAQVVRLLGFESCWYHLYVVSVTLLF